MLNISFYLFLSLNFYFLPFCLISKLLFSTVVVVLRLKYFSQAMLAYFTVQSCNRGSKATKPEANWRQKTERGVESRQRENENVVISFSVFPLFHFPLSLSLSLSLKCCFSLTRYNNYCFNSVLVFLSLKRAFRKDRLKLRDLIMILFTYPRPTT